MSERLKLIGLPYRLGATPDLHGAADCLTLSKYILKTYGIDTPEGTRDWYRRLRRKDYEIFKEQLELWGVTTDRIAVGTVALCKAQTGFALATFINDFPGWLCFRGTEVVWSRSEDLNIEALYCPGEQELCETLGISSAEYFEFHELVSRHVKEEQGRDLIPDIRNEPVTIVTLVVGLALSAIGMLLAPKPQAPQQQERGGDFRGADRRARSKYAPLSEFDSVQDLASLGDVIPLVFTNRDSTKKIGGVRVDSQMLWSRMRNRRLYQELYALMLFSAGAVGRRPDFDGFAFGSTKMSAYTKAKLSIWFAQGLSNVHEPFTVGGDQNYEEGTKNVSGQGRKPFDSYWPIDLFRGDSNEVKNQMVFCGVITPSQSSVFGQYSPIRNGHAWKYPFKYPGKGDGDASRRNLVSWTQAKMRCRLSPRSN